jgi:hypothetical protein
MGPRMFLRFTTNADVASATLSQRRRASVYSGDSAWARLAIEHYAIAMREVIWVVGNVCGGYGTALHIWDIAFISAPTGDAAMTRIAAAILVYLGSRAVWERSSANAYAGATALVAALFALVSNVVIVLLCFLDNGDRVGGGRSEIVLVRIMLCVWLAVTVWAATTTIMWSCAVARSLWGNGARCARNDIDNQLDDAERRRKRSDMTTTRHERDTTKYK